MSDPALPGAALNIVGEEALPDDAVALTPEIVSNDAVAMAPDAAPTSSVSNKPVLGSKVEDILFMYDLRLANGDEARTRRVMELYARYAHSTATLESFYGYEGLVSKLQAYRTIRELVLFIHGEPGGFSVVYEDRERVRPLSLVIEEDFQWVAPQVTNQVILESCVVARDPSRTVKLKNLFQAPVIIGWNFFHLLDPWRLPLSGNVSADQIRGVLQYPDEYLLPGMPHPTAYAGESGTFHFLYEWFRNAQDPTPPGLNPDRREFVPRANATAIVLSSTQASGMETLKDDRGSIDYLAHVTIKD
jgi:hypothetical protein